MSATTIAAISTPAGTGGIAMVRVSGPEAISIVGKAWRGRPLAEVPDHTASLGNYFSTDGSLLDRCVATVFKSPRSFTGEDVVELSIHGSVWIQREIMADLIRRGAHTAGPGEFTQRAFLNRRLDLAQAEGVADLIASSSKAAHDLAISQTKGRFSLELETLRQQLIEFASLLELELDFSEEDVEFADRTRIRQLAEMILKKVERLANSYSSGSVIKEGIPVVIAGIPNAGKSSLLNLLLDDDKAIVTDIPGTTRDTIEDIAEIDGILFRFVDTAGLRDSDDAVETIGIQRARARMKSAKIVIWVFDPFAGAEQQIKELRLLKEVDAGKNVIVIINKSDIMQTDSTYPATDPDKNKKSWNPMENIDFCNRNLEDKNLESIDDLPTDTLPFSAKTGKGLAQLKRRLKSLAFNGFNPEHELIVTNSRHYEALTRAGESLRLAIHEIDNGTSADFIAQDVREAIHHLGTITGTITTPDLLSSIFSRFCIGK